MYRLLLGNKEMICDKCNKKLRHVKDVVGDPFMYCTECRRVWVEY
jgi:Zn-finger nucleic acid-binding protein